MADNDFTFLPLKCFICGRALTNKFVIVQLNENGDNVMLVHKGECVASVWNKPMIRVRVDTMPN